MDCYIRIDLDDAQLGMKLWRPIVDDKGTTIFPDGTELTPSIITFLQRRGLSTIDVADDRVSQDDLRIEREKLEKRLRHLFRQAGDHATARLLMQCVLAYRFGEKI